MSQPKQKPFDYAIILFVFAITGTSAAFLSRLIMPLTGLEGGWPYWLVYVILITPIYVVLLLSFAYIFGKFSYFYEKQKKIARGIARPFRRRKKEQE